MTPTWLATPMTVANAKVSLAQLTPISLVATEPQVVVTNAKSPFNTFADFVAAAKKTPDTLVQTGGSSTANDALTRLVLQDTLDARWKFLSFEDTGSRITALLRDDANIMLGSASDVAEQVKAGQLKVIAVIGDQRLETFPDVSTTEEQGIDSSKVPVQFRAVMGAPDMPADAVQKYQDDLVEDGRDRGLEDPHQGRRPGDAEPPGRQVHGVSAAADRHRRRPACRTRTEEGSVTSGGPTSALATFVAEQESGRIPEPVMHAARRALVDHIGVTVAGSADDATRRAREAIAASENGGGATVVGARMRVSPPFAAFLNAFASHVLDLDDVYNPPGTTVHGSCSVWPAILAIADDRPVSGRDALASFALGFEVETRVAHAAGQTHYDAGWHVTGTSGHVGAAAAAARTMGLDREQIEHAMAAGATQAAGLRIMAGSDLKSMHPGKAAMDGVLAATLVEHRLTASAKALEGDFGYLAVMSDAPAPEKISAGLGDTWNLTSNGHKLYPSGSLTHPMVDGVIALVTENDVAPGDVTVIDVRVSPPAARFTDLPRPATPMQAKFSLRHCAAAAVVFRRLGTEELSAEVLARRNVIDLRDRVKVVSDPALGKQDADVEITLASGRTLSTEVRGNRGTPSAPLGDDELGVKFRELVGPVLGAERAERLLDTCWRVDELPNVSVLLEQTVPAADG